MNAERLAAVFLIGSFVSVMFSLLINAPGLYATRDIDRRLQIIETYRRRWLTSQALVVLYFPLTIVGFSLLASLLQSGGKGWIPVLGAVAIALGVLAGTYFVYLQTTDPRGGYSGAYPTPENVAYWLWLAGMVLFGIAFLQASIPAWLGYLTAGIAVLYGLVFLLTGAGFMTPFILALLSLIIAIFLLNQ